MGEDSSGPAGTPAGPTDTADNGRLDPGKSTAGSVPVSVTTDANGIAQFDLIYLKQYAGWVKTEITATTMVSGTETKSVLNFWLPFLESEKSLIPDSPWGEDP